MSYQSIHPFLVDGHATLGPARHLVVADLKSKRMKRFLKRPSGAETSCSSETGSSSKSSGDPGLTSNAPFLTLRWRQATVGSSPSGKRPCPHLDAPMTVERTLH